jgi:hypothetical protein
MSIRLNGSTSGYTEIDAPALAGSNTLTLPTGNGSSGQVLSTNGSGTLSFVDRMTAAGPAFRAYLGSNQTITNNVTTKVNINTENYDTASCFDTSAYRFTPNVAGYYSVAAVLDIQANSLENGTISIYKNGALDSSNAGGVFGATYKYCPQRIASFIYFNGSSDYIELYAYVYGANGVVIGGSSVSYFAAALIRPA